MLKHVVIGFGLTIMSMASFANTLVEMKTTLGVIEIELFDDQAPISTQNFKNYIQRQFYTGTIFHRVIPGFMIQGGGFDINMNQKQTLAAIRNESGNGLKNTRGTLAMARTSNPNSATSQFFINVADNDFLNPNTMDAGYAVFGQVRKGMQVVDKIVNVPSRNDGMHQNMPQQPVEILSMRLKSQVVNQKVKE